MSDTWRLLLHGGTSLTPAADEPAKARALDEALTAGSRVLAEGGAAAQAVVASVASLEESGVFLAGRGSTPQLDGVVRCDASLMSSDGRAGAVQSVTTPRSAILAAKAVYARTQHTSLVGAAADQVLPLLGVETQAPSQPSRAMAECVQAYLSQGGRMFGTVGAVALDSHGQLAAATSTGGYDTALPGRTGDSGAIGIGTFASPRCAISCTGDGDRFLTAGAAAVLDAWLEVGLSWTESLDRLMARLASGGARGGLIGLTADGALHVGRNVPVLRHAGSGAVDLREFPWASA